MSKIYTIGFTKKSAQTFFELLAVNKIEVLLDVRLKNTSQLAGFSRYPDIEYFFENIIHGQYISDILFAPSDEILKNYKKNLIDWNEYVYEYEKLMLERNIKEHILRKYKEMLKKTVCLLCSEEKANHCHRSLVAAKFHEIFGMEVINL